MKRAKAILATVAATFATIAGLDITGFANLLPPDVAKLLVIIPSAAAAIVHLAEALSSNLDKIDP